MAMNFEELNEQTRQRTLDEFEQEQAGPQPFVSKRLTPAGKAAFPELMRKAILEGNEETLGAELANSSFWWPTETYVSGERKVNIPQAAEQLARNEFNTWYVRGFARRLLDEGVAECQVYRAAPPKPQPMRGVLLLSSLTSCRPVSATRGHTIKPGRV